MSSGFERGLSLVELMVALTVGALLILAVLVVQLKMSRVTLVSTSVGLRDNEVRAAMDRIGRDVSSAGFVFAGANLGCHAVLSYDAGLSPDYFASFPVSAIRAVSAGYALPFVGGAGITVGYPADGNRSDVLLIRASTDTSKFPDYVSPTVSTAYNPAIQSMFSGILPVATSDGIVAGDVGLLQVPVGAPGSQQVVCLRVPISQTSVAPAAVTSSAGPYMPPGYAGFSDHLSDAGLPGDAALADVLLQFAKLTDVGPASDSNQLLYAYFVDNADGYPAPSLVRATINALTDLEVPNSRQVIATGVVSMQVLFGVDTATPPAGAVGQYQDFATLRAAGNVGNIRSVKVLTLSRSLYPDPTFTNPNATIDLQAQFGEAGYADYSIPSAYLHHRFVAHEVELSPRNSLWDK